MSHWGPDLQGPGQGSWHPQQPCLALQARPSWLSLEGTDPFLASGGSRASIPGNPSVRRPDSSSAQHLLELSMGHADPFLGRESNQDQAMRSELRVVGRARAGVSFGLGAGPNEGPNLSEGAVRAGHRRHIGLCHMPAPAPDGPHPVFTLKHTPSIP